MKKKILLVLAIISLLICMLAISVSAQRVEDYDATFTLKSDGQIVHYQNWSYNDGKSWVRKSYTNNITISFFDEEGNPITEVCMWEYDENEGKYYSLVWYISQYELFWEDQIYSDANVGDQTYPKYISANYTLSKVRAVDLRYVINTYNTTHDVWKDAEGNKITKSLKSLKAIYHTNGTPDDTSDDIRLQHAQGIGRDYKDYGYVGYEAQFEATGNKIVVGNFRDCDFQRDEEGNYGTANTWSRADNLQCLWYPDTMLYICAGIGPVYEVDLGDSMEVIACQILRDNKRVKEIVIPNSVLFINNEAFRGTDLTKVTIGENLVSHGNDPFLYTGVSDNIVISKNVLYSTTANIGRFLGGKDTKENIYLVGDEADAIKLKELLIAKEAAFGNSGRIVIYDYAITQERADTDKYTVIFYNYNRCEAFYHNQHSGEEKVEFDGAQYLTSASVCVNCTLCGNKTVLETVDTLFVCIGYSYNTNSNSIMQGFAVNRSVISKYEALYSSDISFGLVAALAEKITDTTMLKESSKVSVDYTKKGFDVFEMKLSNITESVQEANLFLCAYITVGDKTYYISNGEINEDAKDFAVNYKEIVEIA